MEVGGWIQLRSFSFSSSLVVSRRATLTHRKLDSSGSCRRGLNALHSFPSL